MLDAQLADADAVDRAVALLALVSLSPTEAAEDLSVEGRLHVLRMLREALGAERALAHAWSPAYSADRHAALLKACRDEEIALRGALRAELAALSDPRRRVA